MTYVEIEPLECKHYSTNIHADLPNNESIHVKVAGYNSKPSPRELDNGWEPDYGMDHVEGDKVYEVACRIKELLEDMYGGDTND